MSKYEEIEAMWTKLSLMSTGDGRITSISEIRIQEKFQEKSLLLPWVLS